MEQVRRAYEVLAERHIELVSSTQVHADDLALIEGHLSIRPCAVLDVGCGPGHLTAHLRSQGVDATGLDLVSAFIDMPMPPTRTAVTSSALCTSSRSPTVPSPASWRGTR